MITSSKIKLRDKRLSHARSDYLWQTDPELALLNAVALLTTSFQQYLLDYTDELCYPTPAHRPLAIETLDGEHIGNCVYHDTDENRNEAELGIMIGNRNYWDKGYGTDAVTALVNYLFSRANLKRIYLKTLDWNRRAQRCFEKCGFKPYGHLARDGYNFVLMELTRKQWEEDQQKERG